MNASSASTCPQAGVGFVPIPTAFNANWLRWNGGRNCASTRNPCGSMNNGIHRPEQNDIGK